MGRSLESSRERIRDVALVFRRTQSSAAVRGQLEWDVDRLSTLLPSDANVWRGRRRSSEVVHGQRRGGLFHFVHQKSRTSTFLYVLQLERQAGEWSFVGGYAGEGVTAKRSQFNFAPDRGLTRAFLGRASYNIDATRTAAMVETADSRERRRPLAAFRILRDCGGNTGEERSDSPLFAGSPLTSLGNIAGTRSSTCPAIQLLTTRTIAKNARFLRACSGPRQNSRLAAWSGTLR